MHTQRLFGGTTRVSHPRAARTAAAAGFLLASCLGGGAWAQSPFSSGTGPGSILLDRGGFIQFEAADKAIQVGYQYENLRYVDRQRAERPAQRVRMVPRLGASLRAAADNNRGSIFADDQLAAGGKVTVNFGWSNLVTYRRSRNEDRRDTPLRIILRRLVEEGGATRLSLKDLLQKVVDESVRLQKTIARTPAPDDTALTKIMERQDTAAAVEGRAAAELNAAVSEAARERLRAHYHAAVAERRVADAAFARLVRERTDSLNAASEGFRVRRDDYMSLHPAIAREVARRYPSPAPSVPPAPESSGERSMTPEERFVLRYILDGAPSPDDVEEYEAHRRGIAMARHRLAVRGPGNAYWDQLDLRVGASRSQHRLLAPDAAFGDQVVTEKPVALTALVSYSIEYGSSPGGAWPRVLGIGVGAERRDNSGALSSVDLRDVVFSSESDPSSGRRVVRTGEVVRKVLRGTLDEYNAFVASTDFVLYPPQFKNRVGVNAFTRYASGGAGVDDEFTPGIGAMLVKEGAPRKVLGGISLAWKRTRDPEVDLVVGFNF